MPVMIASISSAAVGCWLTMQKSKTKKDEALVEALNGIPEYPVSCLKPLLTSLPHQRAKKLVFLRGVVLPRSYAHDFSSSDSSSSEDGIALESSSADMLRSPTTGQHALVVDRSTIHIYNQRSNFMGYTKEDEGKKVVSKTRKQVLFIIADHMSMPCNDYVVVNLEGNPNLQLPLEKVFSDRKQLFNRLESGYELQVDEVNEEGILPLGNVVTVVGVFSSENGIPTMKPSKDVPYFIISKTKKELIAELNAKLENVTDSLTRLSVGLYGFAIGAFVTHLISNMVRER